MHLRRRGDGSGKERLITHRRTGKISDPIRPMGARFFSHKEGVTYMERDKIRINPEVLN